MGGVRKWPQVGGPPISVGRLVLMLTTLGQQLLFLLEHDIISPTGVCHKCLQVITGTWTVKGNTRYWKCLACKVVTSCRFGTVLYKSKMKLKNWVLLAYCFTERNRTYAQTANEASLPQEGYEDRSLSTRTINRWYRFFRMLCRLDFRKNKEKIGGEGTIIEGDESLFGKMKFGRGAKKNRRRAWVFGMICRTTRRLFLYVCPRDSEGKYKRTRRALIPMILANVKPGSLLYTDGWMAYRRLNEYGYQHKWINHDLHYCDPDDPSINTNTVEGLWAQVKRWLPNGGTYNLTEYLELYQWFYQQKLNGKNPFWRLLELIAESNSYESVNSSQVEEEPDVHGQDDDDDEEEVEEEEEEYHSDDEEHYWYDCIWCKDIWLEESERDQHLLTCSQRI